MSNRTVIINGTPTAIMGNAGSDREIIEDILYDDGFKMYPKDLSTNITTENIQKHPELFERFVYVPGSCGLITIKDELTNENSRLDFINGKLMYKIKSREDSDYGYHEISEKYKEYLEEFYSDELKEFIDRKKTLNGQKYIFEDREEYGCGGNIILKYIIEEEKDIIKPQPKKDKPTRPKGSSVEQNPKISVNQFVDAIKSLTPEQLNMKVKVANGDEEPKIILISDFMNQANAVMNAIAKMEADIKSKQTIAATPVGKAHTAKDIDFNNPEQLMRVDDKGIDTPIIEPKEERFIVDNGQVNQQVPVQQQPQQSNSVTIKDQQLANVITRLQAAGTFVVTMNIESGITRVIVKDTKDKQIDNLCFTVDLDGVCQAPLRKIWFGLPKYPDFEPSYLFDDKSIEALFTGEGFDQLNVVFNKNTCDVNRLVDIRSIFNIPGITSTDDVMNMIKVINGILKKRSMQIELAKKENAGIRFTVGSYKDPKNFKLVLKDKTYKYIGGPVANNRGKYFYVGIENNQMRFFAGKKPKKNNTSKNANNQQTTTQEPAVATA